MFRLEATAQTRPLLSCNSADAVAAARPSRSSLALMRKPAIGIGRWKLKVRRTNCLPVTARSTARAMAPLTGPA